jgi:muramidase (phage lysozyme)
MAKIYESAGRRVQLTGPRSGRGFSPAAAVDRTSAVRQQSAENIRQLERAQSFQQRSFGVASEAIIQNYKQSVGLSQDYFETAGRSQLANNRAANELQMQQTLSSWESTNQMADNALRSSIQRDKEKDSLYLQQLAGVKEANIRRRAQTTEALSQFSRTLSDFIVKTLKAKNEEEYKLYLGKALAGEIKIEDGQLRKFKQAERVLASAAATEGQLNEVRSQVDLAGAEEDRATNPVLKGWAAVGAATGLAKRAASQYQTAMDAFMSSRAPTVPLPDGRMISPREARGPSEIKAALAVGTQVFMEATGIVGINPTLLYEHLTPTVESVNNAIIANIMAQGRAEDKNNALFQLETNIGVSWQTLNPEDAVGVQDYFQQTVKGYQAEGISRSDANSNFVNKIVQLAVATENIDLLAAFELTPINPDNPGMGTLGTNYPGEFQKAYTEVAAASQRFEREREEEENQAIELILAEYSNLLSTAGTNKESMTQAFDATRQRLTTIASTGNLKAIEAINKLDSQGALYNPFAYNSIVANIQAGGVPPTENQLRQLELEGTISGEEGNRIRRMKPDDRALEITKGQEQVIKNTATALLRETLGTEAVDMAEIQVLLAPFVDTLTAEAASQIRNQVSAFMASKGGPPSPAELNGLIQSVVNAYRSDPRFKGKFDPKTGRITPQAPLSRSPFVTQAIPPGATAPVQDFTRVQPYEIQIRQPNTRSSILLSPQELEQNTQNFVNGAPPTPRAQQLMSATGQSFENLINNQAIAQGLPSSQNVSQSSQSQASAERRRLSPAAAAIIDDPNMPAWRKTAAFRQINQARVRAQRAAALEEQRRQEGQQTLQQSSQGLDQTLAGKVQALRPLMDLIGGPEGGAQQYNAINRGVAGDTPAGYPNLSNLTIAEVMRLQREQGYNAVGRYQFIPGTLAEVVRSAKLDPATTKFSPAVQDQLFVERVTNSPVRPRLGAFLRGESDNINGAIDDLSNEFGVVRNFNGRGNIEGIAGNKPSIEATQAAQMLRRVREQMQRSMTPNVSISRLTSTLGSTTNLYKTGNGTTDNGGLCVTAVIETLHRNGLPNDIYTSNDPGNNPRGLAAQLTNRYNFRSLQGYGRPTQINSPGYGAFQANVMSLADYRKAVNAGAVPSGAVVFQTRHSDWNQNSDRSRGFDAAIARNGGRQLFNGIMNQDSIYSNTTQVFVLIHAGQ